MNTTPNPLHTHAERLTFGAATQMCAEVGECVLSGHAHALVTADEDGDITDKVVLELFSIDHAVGWAMGFRRAEEELAESAVLISVVTRAVEDADHLDRFDFDCLRSTLGSTGMELHDWILTDGLYTRSLAYSFFPNSAWLNDPLELRTQQLGQLDPGLILGH